MTTTKVAAGKNAGKKKNANGKSAKPGNGNSSKIELRLYIAGQTPKSMAALANLKKICEAHFEDEYHVKVIDLLKQPKLARGDQILAIPTLVRSVPAPLRKVIGDLSNTERVLIGLDVRPTHN